MSLQAGRGLGVDDNFQTDLQIAKFIELKEKMREIDDLSLLQVCLFLDPNDLTQNICLVCKKWYLASIRNELWRYLCFRVHNTRNDHQKLLEKTNPEEFLKNNIIDVEKPPYFYKSRYFAKTLVSKLIVLRGDQYGASNPLLVNDASVLEFKPPRDEESNQHGKSKKKGQQTATGRDFVVYSGVTDKHIRDIANYRDFVCVTEYNDRFIVINLCKPSHLQKKKNHLAFEVEVKYVLTRTPITARHGKCWEKQLVGNGMYTLPHHW